ncbi:MAG TPA: DUF2780 domain-containing protein [Gemmataceae bacterium]|nr:DUF2780 domain-containing protein [Gemmataceae bacterium]
MAQDFINDLAERSGINADQAKKGLGAVLGFLQDKLPAESFSKVTSAVPGADRMMAAATEAPGEESGGIVSTVTGAIGKLFGGGAGEMVSKLSNLGLSVDQVKSFLPNVLAFLKDKLPADIVNKISGLIPTPQESAA